MDNNVYIPVKEKVDARPNKKLSINSLYSSSFAQHSNPGQSSCQQPEDSGSSLNTQISFEEEDYNELMKDLYYRTLPNPDKGSAALLIKKPDGTTLAYQYRPPYQEGKVISVVDSKLKCIVPEFRPIATVVETHASGVVRHRCTSPGGSRYIGRKSLDLYIQTPEYGSTYAELISFSPQPNNSFVYRGSKKPESIFIVPEDKHERKDLVKDFKESATVVKGGRSLNIDPPSIAFRKEFKRRKPDQNGVMKGSAVNAYSDFLDQYHEALEPQVKKMIKESIEAPLKDPFLSCKRTEWLHLYGFGLTPQSFNPQVRANLGAAPKWANTEMMVSEYILQWLGQHAHKRQLANIEMSITPYFEMILDTDIVKHINYETVMKFNGRLVKTFQSINPFAPTPYRKKCDVAYGALFIARILNGEMALNPIEVSSGFSKKSTSCEQEIVTMPSNKTPYFIDAGLQKYFNQAFDNAHAGSLAHPFALPLTQSETVNCADPQKNKEVFMKQHGRRIVDDESEDLQSFTGRSAQQAHSSSSEIFPSHHSASVITDAMAHSIIKIKVTGLEYDYDIPYSSAAQTRWNGSGFVIMHNDEKIIVTNAHVVDDASHIQLFSTGNHEKYQAYVEYICAEADLAIIKPKDPAFFQNIDPLVLSEELYLSPGTDISVKGYPLGGEELCETFGKISRIEVDHYVHRGQELLQFQVDAAINPGNSGGPVFHNNKIIGVAFQGMSGGEGLGYIIPNVILKHFLADRLKDPILRGFPDFPIEYQSIENKTQKQALGLVNEYRDAGVLVTRIPPLFSGKGVLKKEDILIGLNSKKVNSDGTIDYPWRAHVNMTHEVQMMSLDQRLNLRVLRKGQPLDLSFKLSNKFSDVFHVSPTRYNRKPTYAIESGLVFAPVSKNNVDFIESEVYKGRLIHSSFKSEKNEEIIYISNILISEFTEGYESAERNIIKRVHGVDIKNMPQLLQVLGSITPGTLFEVIMFNDQVLHIIKFDERQTLKMCKKHDIAQLVSDDLLDENIHDYFLRDTIMPNFKHPSTYREIFLKEGAEAATAFDQCSDDDSSDPETDEQEEGVQSSNQSSSESEDDSDLTDLIASDEDEAQDFRLDPMLLSQIGSIASRQRALLWDNTSSSSAISHKKIEPSSNHHDHIKKSLPLAFKKNVSADHDNVIEDMPQREQQYVTRKRKREI
ncbi:serine protease [bacterium]|nr:serine protease [bacterium]NBW57334.1 serine protease [bacterium]NBX71545.1 serine protease [bacterium]